MSQPDMPRLAEAVAKRRTQLGLTQGDLKARGGPAVVTVGAIERCEAKRLQPLTLAGLDKSLDWPAGTAAAILYGDELPSAERALTPTQVLEEAIAALDRTYQQARLGLESLRNGR